MLSSSRARILSLRSSHASSGASTRTVNASNASWLFRNAEPSRLHSASRTFPPAATARISSNVWPYAKRAPSALRSSGWYASSLDFPNRESSHTALSRNSPAFIASRNCFLGKNRYSTPSVSCAAGARDVVATHRPNRSGNRAASAFRSCVLPTPLGPQSEMMRGRGGRTNRSRRDTALNAFRSFRRAASNSRSNSAPFSLETPNDSRSHPVSHLYTGASAELSRCSTPYRFMSLKMAFVSSAGQHMMGLEPTPSAAPNKSTGSRSSTSTTRHAFMTYARTRYFPVGLGIGTFVSGSLGQMFSHSKCPVSTTSRRSYTSRMTKAIHSTQGVPKYRQCSSARSRTGAPSPSAGGAAAPSSPSPSSGGGRRTTTGTTGVSSSSDSGRFHSTRY